MMKKLPVLMVIILIFSLNATAQHYQTLTYFKNDGIQLELDLFLPDNNSSTKTPLVIYVHGGGFKSGDRSGGHALAKYLNQENIACATISYTLYMKDKSFSCDGILSEKIKAIQIAASQLWHATAYLIDQSNVINIDTKKIFIAGSSAGAETALHAAFWNREQMQLFDKRLHGEFTFAGIIQKKTIFQLCFFMEMLIHWCHTVLLHTIFAHPIPRDGSCFLDLTLLQSIWKGLGGPVN